MKGMLVAATAAVALAAPALAAGRMVGQPLERNEMVIVVQYIQAVTMDGGSHAGHGGAAMAPKPILKR